MNLQDLLKFNKSDKEFTLTKLSSKRANSFVDVGRTITGALILFEYLSTDSEPKALGVRVIDYSGDFVRTSPVIKATAMDSNVTWFETEGGTYRLEQNG
jgi:hypothetical protein